MASGKLSATRIRKLLQGFNMQELSLVAKVATNLLADRLTDKGQPVAKSRGRRPISRRPADL